MYFIIHDGSECVVAVESAVASQPADSPVPSSVPGVPDTDSDTIQVPKNAAMIGVGTFLAAMIILVSMLFRRRRA
jgi:hypothetical protein